MSAIQGVKVTGVIVPTDTLDTYAVIDPIYGIDGLRNLSGNTNDLNSITTDRRRAGMVVGVNNGTTYYKLNPAPWTNTLSDWTLFSLGGTFTGGTVTGSTVFSGGLSANTFSTPSMSATTYLGLPIDVTLTGGTYFQGNTIFKNNTGGTFNIVGPSNYNSGVISGGTWVDNGNGSVILPTLSVALFDNANYFEPLRFYTVTGGTTGVNFIALPNNDTSYILIDYNSGSPKYVISDNDGSVNGSSVILYMIIYRTGNFVHVLEFGNMGSGLPNKINSRIISTDRFARESGCSLGLSGLTSGATTAVTLTSGVVWNGPNRQVVNSASSVGTFFKNYHSGGTWTYTTTGHTVNNGFYDDNTNLISATGGKYLVNWYYRGQEINDHLYEVISNGQYDTYLLAEAATEPNLPELITSHAFLVGRVIIGVGATTGVTQSAFSTVFQPSGAAGIHNNLSGIQGGVAGQYYHLDSNKYNNLALVNAANNFSVNQTFGAGLSAITVSASNYLGLPIDIRVTGGTYNSGTGTSSFKNNTGGTFNVSGYFKPSDDVYVNGGDISHDNNQINLNLTNGNVVTINDLVTVIEKDRDAILTLINGKKLIKGVTYKILNCDSELYTNSRKKEYTTIYLKAIEPDVLADTGIGLFYTPKYQNDLNIEIWSNLSFLGVINITNDFIVDEAVHGDLGSTGRLFGDINSGYFIATNGDWNDTVIYGDSSGAQANIDSIIKKEYNHNDVVFWGGSAWFVQDKSAGAALDIFTLDTDNYPFSKLLPLDDDNIKYYNTSYDEVKYDIFSDKITYRKDSNLNIVSTSVDNINYWVDAFYNPIKAFQWGNPLDSVNNVGVGRQTIIDSYNENINFRGSFQSDIEMVGLSYQTNMCFEDKSYQTNVYLQNSHQEIVKLTNNSYQINISLTKNAAQGGIFLAGNSYQNDINLTMKSVQTNINMNKSSQIYITIFGESLQDNIVMINSNQTSINLFHGSSQTDIKIFDGSSQKNIDISDNSTQRTMKILGSEQSNIFLNHSSKQDSVDIRGSRQMNVVFENQAGQVKGNIINEGQTNIKFYNFVFDRTNHDINELNRIYTNTLLTNNSAPYLIGILNNELVEVDTTSISSPIQLINSSNLFSTSLNSGGGTNVTDSNFFGNYAGYGASLASNSNFFGNYAGYAASGANDSNFFGVAAGFNVINANNSNFIGAGAGNSATNAYNSNFLGYLAGQSATNARFSNLLGCQVGMSFFGNSIGSNNIIIGTNISLPNAATNSINIGGVLFGTGTYSNINTNPSITAQTNGKIGINIVNPTQALHVSGNALITGSLTAATISATTYLGLPTDVYVIGGTYSNGTAIFTNNTGGTFSVVGFASQFTGGTVSGPTNFISGLTATTISATTFNSNIIPNINNSLNIGSSTSQYSNIFSNVFSSNGTGILRSANNLVFQLLGGTLEGGRFFNTGNFSIGTSIDSGFKLDVSGNTRIQNGLTATTISATTYQGITSTNVTTALGFTPENSNTDLVQRRLGYTVSTDFLSPLTAALAPYTFTSINSGTFAIVSSQIDANHPGVQQLISTSGITNSGGYISSQANTNPFSTVFTDGLQTDLIFKLPAVTTNGYIRYGHYYGSVVATTAPTHGNYFEITGTTIVGVTRNTNVQTQTNSLSLSASTWYHARIKESIESGVNTVTFTVYDMSGTILYNQSSTTNINTTTTRGNTVLAVNTVSGTALPIVYLDYIGLTFPPMVRGALN